MADTGSAIVFLIGLAVFSVVLLVIFLVARELVLWYWKVNRSVELQEQILAELKALNGKKEPGKFTI